MPSALYYFHMVLSSGETCEGRAVNMSLLNIFVFAIATSAFVAVIAGLFWMGERMFGATDASAGTRHLPIEHPEDQR